MKEIMNLIILVSMITYFYQFNNLKKITYNIKILFNIIN